MVVVLPEFFQVRVAVSDGLQYTINRRTPGLDVSTLREGDVVECHVTTEGLRAVLHAKRLA